MKIAILIQVDLSYNLFDPLKLPKNLVWNHKKSLQSSTFPIKNERDLKNRTTYECKFNRNFFSVGGHRVEYWIHTF